jgi:hypothetical protein
MIIDGNTLERLEQKADFIGTVHKYYYDLCAQMGVQPHFNKALAQDAYFQWMQDLDRIRSYEAEVGDPDHIKRAAHLVYWLRRFPPVNDFVIGGEHIPDDVDPDAIQFMLKYGREYLAFDMGYSLARFYEARINGRNLGEDSFSLQSSFPDVQSHDFLLSMVHVMKTKMLSPQALVLVFKGVFLRP